MHMLLLADRCDVPVVGVGVGVRVGVGVGVVVGVPPVEVPWHDHHHSLLRTQVRPEAQVGEVHAASTQGPYPVRPQFPPSR